MKDYRDPITGFFRWLYRKFGGKVPKPEWKVEKPPSPQAAEIIKEQLNCPWGIYKKLGKVYKHTWLKGYGIRGERIMAGEYLIYPAQRFVIQPTGMTRRAGETCLQSFKRLRIRTRRRGILSRYRELQKYMELQRQEHGE